jgi:hypothetical protein
LHGIDVSRLTNENGRQNGIEIKRVDTKRGEGDIREVVGTSAPEWAD